MDRKNELNWQVYKECIHYGELLERIDKTVFKNGQINKYIRIDVILYDCKKYEFIINDGIVIHIER